MPQHPFPACVLIGWLASPTASAQQPLAGLLASCCWSLLLVWTLALVRRWLTPLLAVIEMITISMNSLISHFIKADLLF